MGELSRGLGLHPQAATEERAYRAITDRREVVPGRERYQIRVLLESVRFRLACRSGASIEHSMAV